MVTSLVSTAWATRSPSPGRYALSPTPTASRSPVHGRLPVVSMSMTVKSSMVVTLARRGVISAVAGRHARPQEGAVEPDDVALLERPVERLARTLEHRGVAPGGVELHVLVLQVMEHAVLPEVLADGVLTIERASDADVGLARHYQCPFSIRQKTQGRPCRCHHARRR